MPHWIYSTEALPNPELLGKPRYTPDSSYIKWGGVSLPAIPKQQWMKLPESLSTIRRRSWKEAPEEVEVLVRKFKGVIDSQFAELGVIFLDHEPDAKEKQQLEAVSFDLNVRWRKKQIEFFESNRDIAKARQGQYDPSPYVDECYAALNMDKPYSVEAMQALRDPGQKAADRIAGAIEKAMSAGRKEAAEQVAEMLTRPQETQQPQARR